MASSYSAPGGRGGSGGFGAGISSGTDGSDGGRGGTTGAGEVGSAGGGSSYGAGGSGGSGGSAGTAASPIGSYGGTGGTAAVDSAGGGGGGGGGSGYAGYSGGGAALTGNISGARGGNGGSGGQGGGGYLRSTGLGFATGHATGGGGGGGGGGQGGAGALVSGSSVYSTATLQGGAGGAGGAGGNQGVTSSGGGFDVGGSAGSPGTAGLQGGGGDGGDGLVLGTSGAELTNVSAGRIVGGVGGAGRYGGYGGSGVQAASASIDNAGTITGGASGAGRFGVGGSGISGGALTVTNTGTITGGAGGNSYNARAGAGISSGTATVDNSGAIRGGAGISGFGGSTGGAGISLTGSGSSITNRASSTIAGGNGGNGSAQGNYGGSGAVGIAGSGLTITNRGTIQGGNGGTFLRGGYAGPGASGIVGSDVTLVTSGTVAGGTSGDTTPVRADAVTFEGGANILAFGTSATFRGAIDIQAGTLTFDQSAATIPGLILPANTTLSTALIGGGQVIKIGTGTLKLNSGDSTFSGGTTISGGTLDLAAAATLTNGAVTSGAAGTGAITFGGTGDHHATLALEMSAQNVGRTFGNTLDSFGDFDSLDLVGVPYDSMSAAITYDANGHTLTVTSGTGGATTEIFNLTDEMPGAGNTYYARDDGRGGTLVTNAVVCFCTGTLIATTRGDVAVEALAIGDRVVTASGAERPVRWIGHRTVDCTRHPEPRTTWPVRISESAFGPGRPARDLLVSPGHAICIDMLGEVLIPASALINGTTIQQVEVDSVTYWHVELDGHDILLAENLPAESYLEMGNRGFFQENGVTTLDASPDAGIDGSSRSHADFCRPFHKAGPLVDVVRAQLRARALAGGWTLDASDPFAGLYLVVDGVRIEPVRRGLAARFAVPGGAGDVWLVSATARPCEVAGSSDGRALGVAVRALTIDDGFAAPHTIALADPLLCIGFHMLEDGKRARRWTAGRARLPAALWARHGNAAADGFFLRVELASPALPRWVAPVINEADAWAPAAARLSLAS